MVMRLTVCVVGLGVAGSALAEDFDVLSGQTNVVLNTDALDSLASLAVSGTSGDVLPGDLPAGAGETSVAFGINPRNGDLPTTFSYDAGLIAFSGAIEHSGSVFFNDNTVEVGDFTIGFDGGRVGDDRSGFFVESTTGLAAILFDVATPSGVTADADELVISADLLVSSEFGSFLFDNDLSATDLTGAAVGRARVNGVVPAPAASLSLIAGGVLAMRRRRR